MTEPRTKDGADFKNGMELITETGVRFSSGEDELEFAHGNWALFRPGSEQGIKLSSFYSSFPAYYSDKLREAKIKREFWTEEENRFRQLLAELIKLNHFNTRKSVPKLTAATGRIISRFTVFSIRAKRLAPISNTAFCCTMPKASN